MTRLWNFETVIKQEPLFARTEFVVEASDFEQRALWREHHEMVKWESIGQGLVFNIGELFGKEINLDVSWRKINGHVVLFFHCCSSIRDYEQVEEWVQRRLPDGIVKAEGIPSCFASDFDKCLEYCAQPEVS